MVSQDIKIYLQVGQYNFLHIKLNCKQRTFIKLQLTDLPLIIKI